MNNNKIDSIEWHKEQLSKLLNENEFGKIENELDEIVEKFRTKGAQDRSKRKSKKGLKDIISDAFGGKKDKKESSDPTRSPANDVDAQLRNAKRAQIHSRSRSRMR